MNCHPLASGASAATAPSSSPGGGSGSGGGATVYDNNNTIPTEFGMHHQADIAGGKFELTSRRYMNGNRNEGDGDGEGEMFHRRENV